ncbi:MAG: tyrosine-type recombinase/integrase [Minicystis sp.]
MSVKKRKDGRWRIDIKLKLGGEWKRFRRAASGATRGEALSEEAAWRAELLSAPPEPAAKPITFAEHAQEVMALHAAVHNKHSERESKKRIFKLHLVPFFGEAKLTEIGPRDIARFKAQKLAAGLSGKTINNLLTVLRKSLTLGVEWGRLKAIPPVGFLRVKKPEIDFLDFEEAPRLVEGADEGAWAAMILTGLRAGLRQSELLELRWDDVDLANGVMHIRRAIYDGVIDTPKGGRSRDVPMSAELVGALRLLPSRFAGQLVWPGEGGVNLTKGQCKWPLWRACKRAGLRLVGWHVLRHTFASHLVMKGVPLKVVQELLGHTDIATTMRYAHLAPGISRDAVMLLDTAPPRKKDGTG